MDLSQELSSTLIDFSNIEYNINRLKSTISEINDHLIEEDGFYYKLNENVVFTSPTIDNVLKSINAALKNNTSRKSQEIINNSTICNDILETLLDLVSKLTSIDRIPIENVNDLSKCIGHVLYQIFLHCKESETVYASSAEDMSSIIMNIFKKSHLLQVGYLKLLTECVVFDLGSIQNNKSLQEIFSILMNIGKVVINLDVKTTAEQWKYFAKLCETHTDCIGNCYETLREIVTFFCEEISSSLKKLVYKEITDQKNINRTLKLSNFLIKIFLKLVSTIGGNIFKYTCPVFNLLNNMFEYSTENLFKFNLSNILAEGIRSHILISADLIIASFIDEQEFSNVFFDQTYSLIRQKTNIFGCLTLSINIMKALLQKEEASKEKWIQNDVYNIVNMILDSIHSCSDELMTFYEFDSEMGKITLYEYLLINTAAFTISLNDVSGIERKMLCNILKVDPLSAIFASDLWVILSRFGSANYCLAQVEFLSLFINKIQYLSHDIPQVSFLSHLLYGLFALLPPVQQSGVLEKFSVEQNLFLWTIVGLEWIPEEKTEFLNSTIDKACNKVDLFLKDRKATHYESAMFSLDVVSTINLSLISNDKISNCVERLMSLWDLIVSKEYSIQSSGWIIEYINNLCKITARFAANISTENWIKILEALHHQMHNSLDLHLTVLNLLDCFKYSKNEDSDFESTLIPLVSKMFAKLLESEDTLLKLAALESFQAFTQVTCNENVISLAVTKNTKQLVTDYFGKKIPQFNDREVVTDGKFRHKCRVGVSALKVEDDEISCPSKKIKLEPLDNARLERVTDGILKLTNELKMMSANYDLSEEQKNNISRLKVKIVDAVSAI